MTKPTKYENYIDSVFSFIKHNKTPYLQILADQNGNVSGFLEAITSHTAQNGKTIKALKDWRAANQIYFPSQFKVTIKGTGQWARNQLIKKKDRILFFIKDSEGELIGHIGLFRFDYTKKTCEIDNVIRGVDRVPGIMTLALNRLVRWTYEELGAKKIYLTVFEDNKRAIKLYKRCGFEITRHIPLKKVQSDTTTEWLEVNKLDSEKAERRYAIMEHARKL